MMQFEWYDGTVKNIHVDLPVLYNYQVSCPSSCGLVRARLPSNYSSLIVLLAKYCRDSCAESCPCKSAATGILTGSSEDFQNIMARGEVEIQTFRFFVAFLSLYFFMDSVLIPVLRMKYHYLNERK